MFKRGLFFITLFFFSFFQVKDVFAQFSVAGKITDSVSGQPVVSASISINGPVHAGTLSQKGGHFRIDKLPEGKYRLRISYLGYQAIEKTLNLHKNLDRLHFELKEIGLFITPIEVAATRAGEDAPFTKTNISSNEISRKNLGQDLPYLLKQQPALITTSDAGAGTGYTSLWIRGSDMNRINVTINGIPVNDAESQTALFVDIPDIASSTNSIQIQRGVGTSTNGAGAFGATINLSTNTFQPDAYGDVSASYGSFNTQKYSVKAGSGLLNNHFTIDTRLSSVTSDGYIDRASSDLKSFYFSAAYFNKKTALRFNVFSGKEKTYQAWDGVPEDSLKAGNRTYNSLGLMPNGKYYQDQTDNYMQTYYQLFWNQEINKNWNFNVAGFLTRGKGYYEEYKINQPYSDYGLKNPVIGKDTISNTNLIRDRWLDNYFYGSVFSLNYKNDKFSSTLGGGWNAYDGKHYGNIIWAEHAISKDYQYYYNTAYKKDLNIYWKGQKNITGGLTAFLDLQYKRVKYDINGFSKHPDLIQNNLYHFFNPKAGLNLQLNAHSRFYASYAVAHKAPNRKDFEINTDRTPKPEVLSDLELGYNVHGPAYQLHGNIYYMSYKDQLVLTGKINYEGVYTRINVPESYRMGFEINGSVNFAKIWSVNANFALSRNRIKNFTAFFDDYDQGGQKAIDYKETPISFSPPVIAGGTLTVNPFTNFTAALSGKYVSRRYLDNTGSKNRSLDSYFINGLEFHYSLKPQGVKAIHFNLLVDNLFNVKYSSNGYTYAYWENGKTQTENWYFPQAGINFLFGVEIKL